MANHVPPNRSKLNDKPDGDFSVLKRHATPARRANAPAPMTIRHKSRRETVANGQQVLYPSSTATTSVSSRDELRGLGSPWREK
jgi:hypothetical protein